VRGGKKEIPMHGMTRREESRRKVGLATLFQEPQTRGEAYGKSFDFLAGAVLRRRREVLRDFRYTTLRDVTLLLFLGGSC